MAGSIQANVHRCQESKETRSGLDNAFHSFEEERHCSWRNKKWIRSGYSTDPISNSKYVYTIRDICDFTSIGVDHVASYVQACQFEDVGSRLHRMKVYTNLY